MNRDSDRYRYLPIIARIFLGALFLKSGFGKIPGWEGTAGYMAAKGMPFVPFFLFWAIVLEIFGALSIIIGYKARWGAIALIVFLIPTTLIFHNFVAEAAQLGAFVKNFSVLGGLLMILWAGAGPVSVDNHLENRKNKSD